MSHVEVPCLIPESELQPVIDRVKARIATGVPVTYMEQYVSEVFCCYQDVELAAARLFTSSDGYMLFPGGWGNMTDFSFSTRMALEALEVTRHDNVSLYPNPHNVGLEEALAVLEQIVATKKMVVHIW